MTKGPNVFLLPYKVLTTMGLWGMEGGNPIIRGVYWIYQSWAIFYLTLFMTCCLFDLSEFWDNVQRASTNLSGTVSVFMLIWKNTLALYKFPQIQSHQKRLRDGLYKKSDDRDLEIVAEGQKEMKSNCYFIYTLTAVTLTCWLFSPLAFREEGEELDLPLPVWVPWYSQESPYLELAYLYQVYGGYLVAFDVLSLNLTIFGTIIRICTEYSILHKNFQKIRVWYDDLCENMNEPRVLTEEENLVVGKMIVENVRHHQKIIEAVKEAEDFYVHMMLVQFGGASCLVTVVSVDLILVSKEWDSRALTLIILFGLVASDITLFCYFGSRLTEKSYELVNCVYDLPWEAMNAGNRRSISLVIARAQRPPALTVEKFAIIDFRTLLHIIKIIYNFLYLLLHLAGDR